jgi:hypothetical protein
MEFSCFCILLNKLLNMKSKLCQNPKMVQARSITAVPLAALFAYGCPFLQRAFHNVNQKQS